MHGLKRDLAQQIVGDYGRKVVVNGTSYSAMELDLALWLLGEDRFNQMMKDVSRNAGPKKGFIYSWNVVDYMTDFEGYKKR